MNIAVNTRLLINDIHGGIEWFTYETLLRITLSHKEHQFFFLFDRPFDQKYIFSDNITPIVIKPKAVHPFLWYYWMERGVKPALKRISADIFLSPDGMIPLKSDIPCLPVIHDINFFHRRGDLPFLKSLYFRKYFRLFAQRAPGIATVSEYSKRDISESWKIDPSKIDVVYNGVSPIYQFMQNSRDPEKKPYFLFVGNLSPRKNVPNLIRAYNTFRETCNTNHQLIIAGDRFFLNSKLDRELSGSKYREDIILTGKKSPEELHGLYHGAEALIFIPWFEGFGIPIAEAMRCGTPVIASNTTSIPEVAGDAAILADPSDIVGISKAMREVVTNSKTRERMVEEGYKQSIKFSWDITANKLWESILKTVNSQ